jgi:lipopolysaccharide biosynthesis glycosyltransferase
MIPRGSDTPVVVCSADDRFAIALAVMVRSALDNLPANERLALFVIDGGIRSRTRERLLRSWDLGRLEVEWLKPEASRLARMKVSGHVRLSTYYRLLISDLLPPKLSKVLYLDCDLVVEGSLAELWRTDVSRHPLAAVQDMIVPYVSSPWGLPDFRELGFVESTKYFNAGVLLVNLERWRADHVGEAAIRYAEDNYQRLRFWDQEALNAVLAGRWLELPLNWNLTILTRDFPPPDKVPCSPDEYETLVSGPRITHFLSSVKPWHPACLHPRTHVFFEYLDRTAWVGWRPKRFRVLRAAEQVWDRIRPW